jgi:hypothetical protein
LTPAARIAAAIDLLEVIEGHCHVNFAWAEYRPCQCSTLDMHLINAPEKPLKINGPILVRNS